MRRVLRRITRLFADERGQTAIEYGLIAALMIVALIVGLGNYGRAMNNMFWDTTNRIGAAGSR